MAGQGRHRGPSALTVETLVRNRNHLGPPPHGHALFSESAVSTNIPVTKVRA